VSEHARRKNVYKFKSTELLIGEDARAFDTKKCKGSREVLFLPPWKTFCVRVCVPARACFVSPFSLSLSLSLSDVFFICSFLLFSHFFSGMFGLKIGQIKLVYWWAPPTLPTKKAKRAFRDVRYFRDDESSYRWNWKVFSSSSFSS
jgi:hypothetical protein